ncbi:hypothetical protein A2635_03255 [Candidatus Peribacteria bacterium RIFCSPHIGHO2_01_FULL_51_9]|nr:MAG: hypothetical protein A2635_03255 [Candidatus Peribacteria bacterium RIFCSPHIGHO2_01_FULL_51_9]
MKVKSQLLAWAVIDMSPSLNSEEQEALFNAALAYLDHHNLSSEIKHFPRILAKEWYKKEGSIPVALTTKSGNSDPHGERISTMIGSALQKKITLTEEADASLIGGARLSYLDERLDFSIRGALQQFDTFVRSSSSSSL